MEIEVGLDPEQPVPITCSINASNELEVKYGSKSLTHPQVQDLMVAIEELDNVTFRTTDFIASGVPHTVSATTVGGQIWSDAGSIIMSELLPGDANPGQLYEVDVSATNTSTNQTKTVRIRIRIREETIRPVPTACP